MMDIMTSGPTGPPGSNVDGRADKLNQAAHAIEAQFLATLMKSAGLGQARTQMGGGIGEEQFSSFLIEAQAANISQSGGLGLAEAIYAALVESEGQDGTSD